MNRLVATCVPICLIGCSVALDFGSPTTTRPKADGGALPAPDGTDEVPRFSWLNPTPTGNDLHGIWGTADDDVWIAGAHGTVVRWDGQTATLAREGTSDEELYTLWGSNKNDMWIAGGSGGKGEILHWDGKGWSSAFTVGDRPIHALWGTSASDVWALAEAGAAFHFDGKTFQVQPVCNCSDYGAPPQPILRDLWGSSASDLWAVGEAGAIYHRQRNGWERASQSVAGLADPFAATNAYRGIWGSSANDVWAVFVDADHGKGGPRKVGFSHYDGSAWRVTQLEDGGIHERGTEPTRRGHRVWGSSANDIVALVDGPNWHYDGTTWRSMVSERWSAAWGSAGRGLMAVGYLGGWGHLEPDQSWSKVIPVMRSTLPRLSVAPDGSVWAIIAGPSTGTDPHQPSYQLVRWTSNGWTEVPGLPSTIIEASITALSKDDVGVAGTGGDSFEARYGFVARFTNGAWSEVQRVPIKGAFGLAVRNATDAWVVGEGGAAHWNGTTWDPISPKASLRGVTIAAENDVWMVGGSDYTGVVFHWDGSALREVHRSKRISASRAIWASGPNNVWVAGRPGLRYDGSRWIPIENTDFETTAIWGTGASDVWLLADNGTGGLIRHWDGTTLATALEVSPKLYAIAGTRSDDVWIVGSGGATLHYAASGSRPPH